jgi:hypothetical protein
MSDRERAGLRGPVKICVEEAIYPNADDQRRGFTATTEYGPDGRILRTRQGQPNGQEWSSTRTYDAQGRLLKQTSGNSGGPTFAQTYSYDETGRLTGIRSSDKDRTMMRFEYDDQGQKKKIGTFDPLPVHPNVAYDGPRWEGVDLPFGQLPNGGSITTIYNEHGFPIEGQLRDSNGQLVSRILRTVGENGTTTSEKVVLEEPATESLVPPELAAQSNAAQNKAIAAFIGRSFYSGRISYSYDSQGRMTRKERSGGVLGTEITKVTYNEHGDKAEEYVTTIQDPETGREFSLNEDGTIIPAGPPPVSSPPAESETHYTYQYDSYGNWTEQVISSRYSSSEPLRPLSTHRRTLTYY